MAFPSDPDYFHGKDFYRLCARRYTVFDGTGAYLNDARWSIAGSRVIYCGSSLALSAMEVLVHLNTSEITTPFHYGSGKVDTSLGIEIHTQASLEEKGCIWNDLYDLAQPQEVGHEWFEKGEDLFLIVPTVLSPTDFTLLINETHQAFDNLGLNKIVSEPYRFDQRFAPG